MHRLRLNYRSIQINIHLRKLSDQAHKVALVLGPGDFNGDGKADILWQNTDGTSAVWLMNGTSLISGANVGDPGSSWHVVPQHHDLFV
jgi:hypothetical protein